MQQFIALTTLRVVYAVLDGQDWWLSDPVRIGCSLSFITLIALCASIKSNPPTIFQEV